jgi:hypothetical protein
MVLPIRRLALQSATEADRTCTLRLLVSHESWTRLSRSCAGTRTRARNGLRTTLL